jgi:hypothetical protein
VNRYELPDGVSPEEERAIIAALERHLEDRGARPNPWALAGRIEATGQGTLQARRRLRDPWRSAARAHFIRPGTESIRGRGDAK